MSAASTSKRKKFVGRPSKGTQKVPVGGQAGNRIPDSILLDRALNAAIGALPANYSFEIHKTIHHITKNQSTMVALQMPEGLLLYACTISDIIERFTNAGTVIMGDVTYGACCIDDYSALAMGCDLLVHYGHSCLVPIDATQIKTLYVFVEITVDAKHLADTVRLNFAGDQETFRRQVTSQNSARQSARAGDRIYAPITLQIANDDAAEEDKPTPLSTRLALMSTIQFTNALPLLKDRLTDPEDSRIQGCCPFSLTIPRSKPLSPGELLGCTAPNLADVDALLYVGDGRFHLEAAMIANPSVPAFRYDPYSKKLTREYYDHDEMRSLRQTSIEQARGSLSERMSPWGVILGTLGRQGNIRQFEALTKHLSSQSLIVKILLSELSPAKLRLLGPDITTFIQTSCPRLSIDWGYAFDRPLLSPYEAAVALRKVGGWWEQKESASVYPMDFYAASSPWSLARVTSDI